VPFARPAGFAAMLTVGAAAAALHGRLPAGAVLALAAAVFFGSRVWPRRSLCTGLPTSTRLTTDTSAW
jgi:hypothetical protein